MKKSSINNPYIPKLRFKGFDGDYKLVKLDDVLFYEQPTKYLIKKEDYNDSFKTFVLTPNKSFILGKTNEKDGIYNKGPVIILDDFTTDNKYVDFDFKIKSSAIKLLTTNKDNNLFYLFNLINNKKINVHGHNRHWIKILSQELRAIPPLHEQNKIARFLSLLDKQISLLENKLHLYELYFKYYLKNLMKCNKYRIPKLRFKGFDGEWKTRKINELTSFIKSGGTPNTKNFLYYSNQGIPFLSIPDMKNKYLVSTQKFITDLGLKSSSTFILKKNNLLFSIYATIGKISINNIDVALPQSILGIIPNELVLIEYFYYLLCFNKSKICKFNQTGSQPNLSLNIFKNINLSLTLNVNEQNKIKTLFSNLDMYKNFLISKINLVKRLKKYFINLLFI